MPKLPNLDAVPTLDPITIDGKAGTVAYLDHRGELTTVDKAVMAKVVFEDGSRLWLHRKLGEDWP